MQCLSGYFNYFGVFYSDEDRRHWKVLVRVRTWQGVFLYIYLNFNKYSFLQSNLWTCMVNLIYWSFFTPLYEITMYTSSSNLIVECTAQLLDRGLGYLSCSGQRNVCGHDVCRDLWCAYMTDIVPLSFCHLNKKKYMGSFWLQFGFHSEIHLAQRAQDWVTLAKLQLC